MDKKHKVIGGGTVAVAALIYATNLYINAPKPYDIIRVIDGDTVEFHADFLPSPLEKKLALRIEGVDTPEKRGACDKEKELAEKASQFTQRMIDNAKDIKIRIVDWGKFGGRVIGDVLIDGKSLSKELIRNGHAVPYDGGKKIKDWCK